MGKAGSGNNDGLSANGAGRAWWINDQMPLEHDYQLTCQLFAFLHATGFASETRLRAVFR
jgi:hypothetical protein